MPYGIARSVNHSALAFILAVSILNIGMAHRFIDSRVTLECQLWSQHSVEFVPFYPPSDEEKVPVFAAVAYDSPIFLFYELKDQSISVILKIATASTNGKERDPFVTLDVRTRTTFYLSDGQYFEIGSWNQKRIEDGQRERVVNESNRNPDDPLLFHNVVDCELSAPPSY